MRPYASLWVQMGPYKFLFVFKDSIGLYGSLKVLM